MILLASASAARLRLLKDAGLATEAMASCIDEADLKNSMRESPPQGVALALAAAKAQALSERFPTRLVIGADQLLDCEGRLFDKPATLDAARDQLLALKGRTHRLISAVCLMRQGRLLWQHVGEAHLTMRDFSEDFLMAYLKAEGAAALASVGAYRIEGLGVQLFERIEGDSFTIQGLPLLPLLQELRHLGEVAR
ncbi:MAG: septum formation protein Maf [Alphaproteobacteria bacterium]|nr:septum formation protein Maf [Alphaproteobacteria bacterium]